jgi:UDP-glucose 4-epimerase
MMTSSMRIVVTGVAGFLGSHLLDRLIAAGHRVVGIDNLSMGTLDNIRAHLENPGVPFSKAGRDRTGYIRGYH